MIINGIIVAAAFVTGGAMVAVIDSIKLRKSRRMLDFVSEHYNDLCDALHPADYAAALRQIRVKHHLQ